MPVGIITSAFGASTAEAWVSQPTLEACPQLSPLLGNFLSAVDSYRNRKATTAPTVPDAATSKPSTRRAARAARAPRDPMQDQHNPTLLWNAMIKPLQPYAIRGVIWYQGESVVNGNTGTKLYPVVMSALVTSWRQQWGEGDLPFYVCQLAGQDAPSNNPAIREAQAAILKLPNTGMAVTIDIGERKNVHPRDKQDVGDRLCRIALANVYGKPIEFSGPVYQSMTVDGHSIRLKFTHVAGGLAARGGPLRSFTIAGGDGAFVPADAKIDGDTVVVSSPAVPNPATVRYAWSNWPEGCNLYNSVMLPAAPFRTDAMP
jgi:sialate O-acetylesterase